MSTISKVFIFLFLLGLAYFTLFMHLGVGPFVEWDESLFYLRAYHLYDTGELMANFDSFESARSHFNTKLPFTTWIQAGFFKILGPTKLALRLPVVLIFLGTLLYVWRFWYRELGSHVIGISFFLVCISCPMLFREHFLRSGVQDIPYACYLIIGLLHLWRYIHKKRVLDIVFFGLALAAAVLTKNIMIGFLAPGVLFYILSDRKRRKVLLDPWLWIGILGVLLSYGLVLYSFHLRGDGYLQRIWEYDLLGRFKNSIENHAGPFHTYLVEMSRYGMLPLLVVLPLIFVLPLDKRIHAKIRSCVGLLGSCLFSYWLLISWASTKLYWYSAPVVLLVLLLFCMGIQALWSHWKNWYGTLKWGTMGAAIAMFVSGYVPSILMVYHPKPKYKEQYYEDAIDYYVEKVSNDGDLYIFDNKTGYIPTSVALWYNWDQDVQLNLIPVRDVHKMQADVTVLTCLNYSKNHLAKAFEMKQTLDLGTCTFHTLTRPK